jgi:predicted GIY-YIG superfamily endonuclease
MAIDRDMMPALEMRTYQIRWWDGMTMDIQAVRVEVACKHAQRKRHEKYLIDDENFWQELKVRSAETPIIACVEI